MMRVHPLSDDCTEHSPCNDCGLHKKGIDKTRCFPLCKRLAAYRDQENWKSIPELTLADLTTVPEKKKPEKVPELTPDNVTPVCKVAVCLIEGCEAEVYCRDLCRKCYDKWTYGSMDHPVDGTYERKYKTKHTASPTQMRHDKAAAAVRLDFSECMPLQDALKDMAEYAMLPVSHIIMTLLSEAIAQRRRDGLL